MHVVNSESSSLSPYKVNIVDELVNHLSNKEGLNLGNILSRTYIIGIQHLMETELCLFDGLINAGALPSQIRFSGKMYSDYFPAIQRLRSSGIKVHTVNPYIKPGRFSVAIKKTIHQMWNKAIEDIESNNSIDNIVILDEGGRALEEMPRYLKNKYNVAVIEHTRGGLYSKASNYINLPILKPATSAVKKILEPPKIVRKVVNTVLDKVSTIPHSNYKVYGIIGLGNIGKSLALNLASNGYSIIVFDADQSVVNSVSSSMPDNVKLAMNIDELVHNSEVIIGTTGTDVSVNFRFLEDLSHDVYLISASSEDKEFKSLLHQYSNKEVTNPQKDIYLSTDNGNTITIMSGGFPVNFDQASESVPIHDICITRALMLGSVFQACFLLEDMDIDNMSSNLSIATDSSLQYYLAHKYLSDDNSNTYSKSDIDIFSSIKSIQSFTDGISISCEEFDSLKNSLCSTNLSSEKIGA